MVVPKIVIDGVFFQISQRSGIARVWRHLLQAWQQQGRAAQVWLIDRGGTLPCLGDYPVLTLPLYDYRKSPQDAEALQALCDQVQADLFLSTYYTTPLTTPSVFLAHDMIPEVIGMDLAEPCWREKRYSILYASRHIAISHNTAKDLVYFYPHLRRGDIPVVHCGVSEWCRPVSAAEIQQFRQTYGLQRPFVLLLGERRGGKDYKNAVTFFRALALATNPWEFDVLCVGGEAALEPELASLPLSCPVHLLRLDDADLRVAYGAAIALIYPSRYEGFGLPVLEAMACGCPVILGNHSSLPEVAGAAGYTIDVMDPAAWLTAVQAVQDPAKRQCLIRRGLDHAPHFSWSTMANSLWAILDQTVQALQRGDCSPPSPLWLDWRQQEQKLAALTQAEAQRQQEATTLRAQITSLQTELTAIKSSRLWRVKTFFDKAKFW
ncbi:MAG: hypothetical protein RLZZ568_1977 [Cyanobacteriota bacterium]